MLLYEMLFFPIQQNEFLLWIIDTVLRCITQEDKRTSKCEVIPSARIYDFSHVSIVEHTTYILNL